MDSMYSSVLVIGARDTNLEIGADFADDFKQGLKLAEIFQRKVVVLPLTKDCDSFLKRLRELANFTQVVLVQGKANESDVIQAINTSSIFRIVPTYSDPQLEFYIQEALEKSNLELQQEDLIRAVEEQTSRLQSLREDLEERVQKRQKHLEQSKKKLLETNARVEAFYAALVAIHKAHSLAELERLLFESLSKYMPIQWLRIFFQTQNSLESEKDFPGLEIFRVQLDVSGASLGTLVIAREKEQAFRKEEKEFFEQVGKTVTVAIDRLAKLEQSETLKQQWDATFDAILDPLCLTDRNFQIVRTNKSFAKLCNFPLTSLRGKNCFQLIFNESTVNEIESLGDRFQVRKTQIYQDFERTLQISGQLIPMSAGEESMRLILFRDLTDSLHLEKQILESAKMAELGTIGSSIAHELNNPVGGMMSFLQLIKMDLPTTHTLYADINEMEKATGRCKEIIENLLGFARKSESGSPKDFDLRDVIKQSLKITELQSRSLGVQTEVRMPEREVPLNGHSSLLSQAIRNILQNATEAVLDRAQNEKEFEPKIRIEVKILKQDYQMTIVDNGVGIEEKNINKIFNPLFTTKSHSHNSGLGLTVAYKIIREHGGSLEIKSKPGFGTTARISFRRPDFLSNRQVFDGKI